MIGTRIKQLRTKSGMTQKALADMLFVSAQAVSRWENNEVEPSIQTLVEMAKIFEVSVDEIVGLEITEEPKDDGPEKEVVIEKEYVYKDPPKQVLALCSRCNNPIYDTADIVRAIDDTILCKNCDREAKEAKIDRTTKKSAKRRILSFILGPLASIVALVLCLIGKTFGTPLGTTVSVWFIIGAFTFVSCCLLENNFIGDLTISILDHAFIKLPGLIFSFDLEGCLWVIGMKILFFILGIIVSVAVFLFAVAVGCTISLFVYPYAIIKNIKHPEKIEDDLP